MRSSDVIFDESGRIADVFALSSFLFVEKVLTVAVSEYELSNSGRTELEIRDWVSESESRESSNGFTEVEIWWVFVNLENLKFEDS